MKFPILLRVLLLGAGLLGTACASADPAPAPTPPSPKAEAAAEGERVQPEIRYYEIADT